MHGHPPGLFPGAQRVRISRPALPGLADRRFSAGFRRKARPQKTRLPSPVPHAFPRSGRQARARVRCDACVLYCRLSHAGAQRRPFSWYSKGRLSLYGGCMGQTQLLQAKIIAAPRTGASGAQACMPGYRAHGTEAHPPHSPLQAISGAWNVEQCLPISHPGNMPEAFGMSAAGARRSTLTAPFALPQKAARASTESTDQKNCALAPPSSSTTSIAA